MLRGLTAALWTELLQQQGDADEQTLFRLLVTMHPRSGQIFFHPEDLEAERALCEADLKLASNTGQLGFLVSLSHCWAVKHGATQAPGVLFRALEQRGCLFNLRSYGYQFGFKAILFLLELPELRNWTRSDLLECLLGPLYERAPMCVLDLPAESEPEILTAINRLLSSLDKDDPARFLKHLAVRIELDKFEFKKAPEQLARLVQLASQRKRKAKCEHASYLLKMLLEQRIVTKDQLKSWAKLND